MEKEQQIERVNQLSASIRDGVVELINAGKIPPTWDDHELQTLLASRHTSAANASRSVMRGVRGKSFHRFMIDNYDLVNNRITGDGRS